MCIIFPDDVTLYCACFLMEPCASEPQFALSACVSLLSANVSPSMTDVLLSM